MSRFNVATVFLIVTFFVIIAVVITPNTTVDNVGFAVSSLYPGYALSLSYVVNSFLVFPDLSTTISRSFDVFDSVIYRYGYVSYDGQPWTPFTLTTSNTISGDWIYTKGIASISFTPIQLHMSSSRNVSNNTYVVIYTCSKTTSNTWDCHDGWQITKFNAKIITQTTPTPNPIPVSSNINIFYIDSNGVDTSSRNGSVSAPWKSLAYACSQVKTSGRVIHVNKGTYTETSQCNLAPDVSIEGEGIANSIIKSHYVGGTSDWNNGFILLSGGINMGQHISGIYFDGDSNAGDNGIVIYDRSNVSIYNCTLINFYQEAIRFWGSSTNIGNSIHDCTITDCSASTGYDYRTEAIGLGYQTGFLFYNNILTNNGRSNGENGDGMRLWDEIYAPKIYNNHFIGPEVCNGANNYPFVIEFWNPTHYAGYGTEIYGNDFIGQVDFGSGGGKGNYDYAFYVHDNYFHATSIHPVTEWTCGLQIEEHVNDIIISNNLFKNLETPIYLCSQDSGQSFSNIKIYNNIFTDVVWGYQAVAVPAPGQWSTHGTGIMIGGSVIPVSVSNIYIWNNVFTAYSTRPAETAIWLPTAHTCSNIYIQNNIFVGFSTAPIIAQLQESGGTLDNVVIQKNVYNNNGNSNNFLQKYFTATHVIDDGGIIGDPSFVSSTDFHLQTNSPAIWNGTSIGLTTDYEGSIYHSPPSIGAFEYP